ncbi:MAG TPA: hypothetical protein DIT25_02410 [Candidatus Moranbacteria bacterium]|nr:hypothetical protein [Candidatus Moranbacteria bacterium]
MAEEKKEQRNWGSFLKNNLAEMLVVGMFIPFVKSIFEKFSARAGDKVEKRLEKALGIEVEETGKGIGDEIIYLAALQKIDDAEQGKVEEFKSELKKDANAGAKKAEAFVLFIAKGVKAFEKEHKTVSGGGKNNKEPRTEYVHKDLTVGFEWSSKFFKRLLSKPDYAKKLRYLEDENVFSLIPLEKTTPLIIKKASEVFDVAQENAQTNLTDLEGATKSWADKMKEKYEKSKGEGK